MEAATHSIPASEQLQTSRVHTLEHTEAWVANVALFWAHRRTLTRATMLAFLLSSAVAFILPNKYGIVGSGSCPRTSPMVARQCWPLWLSKGSTSGLAGLAGNLLGTRGNGALFISLLHSGTVSGESDYSRFQLQHVYRKRYLQDTAKKLAARTSITEDSKSGVITIVVEDGDRRRARDLTQAYVDELNTLVARVNTSSARLEREFIEQRLRTVASDLQQAQQAMSNFSTKDAAIDIKEQTRAMVDEGAKLQGQLIAGEAELNSVQQIYGDQNVRVRVAAAAR